MEKLIEVLGEIIPSGIHPALPNQAVPLWEDGRNVVFEEMGVTPGPGHLSLFAKLSADTVTGMMQLDNDGTREVYWGSDKALYRGIEGVADAVDLSRVAGDYAGAFDDIWSFAHLGLDIVATNNKVDEPQIKLVAEAKFENFDAQTDLPDTFRARIFKNTDVFIIAFNTDNDDAEYRWCAEDDLTVWTPKAENKARDKIIRGLNSPIQAVEPLGPGWGVFGRSRLFHLSFTGPPFFFDHQHLLDGIGALGPSAVTSVGRRLYGAGPDGCWETDGATFNYITTPSMHKFMFVDPDTSINETYEDLLVTWTDLEESIIYFSYYVTRTSGITTGFDYEKRVWSIHSYWRTAASSDGIWDNPIVGTPAGAILEQGLQGVAAQAEPNPVKMKERSHFVTGYGEIGYGEVSYGSDWYTPGPLESDEV